MVCENIVTTKIYFVVNSCSKICINQDRLTEQMIQYIHNKMTIITVQLEIHFVNLHKARIDCCWLNLINCKQTDCTS